MTLKMLASTMSWRRRALYDAAMPALRIIARDPASRARAGLLDTAHGDGAHARLRAARDARRACAGSSADEVAALGYDIVLGNTFHLFLAPGGELIERLRRAAPLHGLGSARSSPTPAASRSSRWGTGRSPTRSRAAAAAAREAARSSRSRRRASASAPTSTAPSASSARRPRWRSRRSCTPTSCWRSTSARRSTSTATTRRARRSARTAGSSAASRWRAEHDARRRRSSTGSCRAASTRTCASSRSPPSCASGCEGIAIGGSLGQEKAQMHEVVDWSTRELERVAPERPRHLLGIGEIDDLIRGVELGIDSFDCAMPTRLARHGVALVADPANALAAGGRLAALPRLDAAPLLDGCPCPACAGGLSRAYLHYLLALGRADRRAAADAPQPDVRRRRDGAPARRDRRRAAGRGGGGAARGR